MQNLKVITTWEQGTTWDKAKQKFIAKHGMIAWVKLRDNGVAIAVVKEVLADQNVLVERKSLAHSQLV